MTELIAKPIIRNKFWIVEDQGIKVATIQAIDETGEYAYVHQDQRELFASIKLLSKKYNIHFAKVEAAKKEDLVKETYGFPTSTKPHNSLLDVQRYLPLYTKTAKSKSYFCAGHYLIKYGKTWIKEFCPKLITLNRYEYQGPFKTDSRAQEVLKELNE